MAANTPRAAGAIRFVPETYEFGKEPVFSGDRVRFEAAVENSGAVAVKVTEFPRSCGCLTFGEDGDLKLPATLAPGERLPLHIEAATDGKTGFQSLEVRAKGTTAADEPIPSAALAIKGRIWTSILTLPEELSVELRRDECDTPLVQTVLLADEWPGNGLEIAGVTSTAADRMRFDLKAVTGKIMMRGLDVQKRHALTITYSIPKDVSTFDEAITITPTLPAANPAILRLHGRIKPDYEFKPDRLFVYSSQPGSNMNRLLVYSYSRPVYRDLQIIQVPEGVTFDEVGGSMDGVRCFQLACHLPGQIGKRENDLILQIGNAGERVRIPIIMVVGGPD